MGTFGQIDNANHRAKLLITDRRNRLSAEIIEASECFNSWSKSCLLLATDGVIAAAPSRELDRSEGETDIDFIE